MMLYLTNVQCPLAVLWRGADKHEVQGLGQGILGLWWPIFIATSYMVGSISTRPSLKSQTAS